MTLKKIKDIAKIRRGASPRPIDDPKYFGGQVGWVRIADVTASNKYLRITKDYVSPLGESHSVRVNKGDLIISIAGTVGRPIIVDMAACIHDGFVQIYDIKETETEYLYYYLKHIEKGLHRFGQSGTQVNLNSNIVGSIEFNWLQKKEQTRIAEILSTADEAIAHTEALIAKYSRIKTGLMQDLLTRGIDEQGNIRNEATHKFEVKNGIKVPEDWEVKPLRSFLSYISYGFTNPMPETKEGPYMVTAANVNQGQIIFQGCRHTSVEAFNKLLTEKSRPLEGDILITKDGTLGRLALVGKETVCINQSVAVLRVKKDLVNNYFLKLLLESPFYQDKIMADSGGSTIKHIYITKIDKMLVGIPKKIEEQMQLLNIIEEKNLYLSSLNQQLLKIQSLKTGLMQDLLSGNVRVPEEVKEELF